MIPPEDSYKYGSGFPTVDPEDKSKCENYSLCARAYNLLREMKEVQKSSILATKVQLLGIDLVNKCNKKTCSMREILVSPNRSVGFLVKKILAGEV